MVVEVGARHTANGGGRSDWQTPPDLFRAMDRRWRFTYDAFASHENTLCTTYSTAEGTYRRESAGGDFEQIDSLDGLRQDWDSRRVFANPPYSRGFIDAAVEKASRSKDEADIIVALLPENRDTGWWRSFIKNQATVYSIGRVRYIDPATGKPGGSPPGGSAIVVWTPEFLDR